MKHYTLVVCLDLALSSALAVEWSNQAAPEVGRNWEPCVRQKDGSWRFSSRYLTQKSSAHYFRPSDVADVAIRYRLSPSGPWSLAAAQKEFRVEARDDGAIEVDAALQAPILLVAPSLVGTAAIGSELSVDPGSWSGAPLPRFAFQWCRDGAVISGANARAYAPTQADDRCSIACVVTASNAAGVVEAMTASLRVVYPAPQILMPELPEEVFDEGEGPQRVETAYAFSGANLVFSATGALIDARTGVLTISTERPVDGLELTVVSENSGGKAQIKLWVTVERLLVKPPALKAADVEIMRSVWRHSDQILAFTPVVAFPGLVDTRVDAIEWSTAAADAAGLIPEDSWEVVLPYAGELYTWELWMRDPSKRNPLASPKVDFAVFGAGAAETARRQRLRFRWRAEADGLWADASPAFSVPAPVVVETAVEWRQLVIRPAKFSGVKPDYPVNYGRGVYWGEGLQMMHAVDREGDVIMTGQDMGGVRRSNDGGRTWIYPANHGLRGATGLGIKIDPANGDVVMAGIGMFIHQKPNFRGAICRTVDRGETWEIVQELDRPLRNPRCTTDVMCCFPVSGGSVADRRWKFVEWTEQTTRQYVGLADIRARFWRSTGGRAGSWSFVTLPDPISAHTRIYQLVQHPTLEDTLFAATEKGLWITTANGDTGSWSQVESGLLSGDVRRVWIDPERPDRMFVAVYRTDGTGGLFFRPDLNGSWERVLALQAIINFGVGPKDQNGRRTIYAVKDRSNQPHQRSPYVHNWLTTGAPSTTIAAGWSPDTAWSVGMLDLASTETTFSVHHNSIASTVHTRFLPSPTDVNQCWTDGYALFWRTEDRGRTWRHSSTGFGGFSVQDVAFDDTDWRHVALAATDVPLGQTFDGFDSFPALLKFAASETQAIKDTYDATNIAGRALTILPVNSARPRRIILSAGNTLSDQILAIYDPGERNIQSYLSREYYSGGGKSNITFIDHSRQNPNLIYAGAYKSIDAGDNFIRLTRCVVGMSQQDADRIYGVSDSAVHFSVDGGITWSASPFYVGEHELTNFASLYVFALSPFNDTMALVRAANHDVLLVRGAPGGTTVLSLNLRAQYAADVNVVLDRVGWDTRDPRVVYASFDSTYGLARIWRGRLNETYTAVAWTDITYNLPRSAARCAFRISPLTGDVIVGNGAGVWVLPPASGPQRDSIWAIAPRPFSNRAA